MSETLILECEELLKTPPYQNLADPKNNASYDLIIMEYNSLSCILPLTERFGSPPVIFTHLCTTSPIWLKRVAGTPVFPMISPNYDGAPMRIWERFMMYTLYFYEEYQYYTRMQPEMEKIIRKYFGDHVLSVNQYHEKVALSLVNIPEWMNKIPLTPNVIPVGGIHLTEAKPLGSVSILIIGITLYVLKLDVSCLCDLVDLPLLYNDERRTIIKLQYFESNTFLRRTFN